MSAAPTPVPHTPVNFLKGGAAGMFSAACIAAIQKVGLEPEDFGSYDYVNKRNEQRRAKCKAYDEAVAAGVPAEDRPPAPTAHDRRLAESQAGHLTMNSTYQRERGNPCTSLVDGYEDNLAPCMPHHGSTSTAGGEHHWVYHNEIGQPRARGLTKEPGRFGGTTDPQAGQRCPVPPHCYDAAALDADEADRIRRDPKLRHEPLAPQEGVDQPASNPVQGGAGSENATTGGPGAAADAAGSGVGDGSDVPLWQKEITGQTAAECIDNFRKAAISAMKQKCADELGTNENAATGGNPSMTPQQYQEHLQEEIDAARADGDDEEAARLRSDLRAAQHANCRAEMGRRLTGQPGAGPPHCDGRCPAGSRPKARGNETGPDLIDPSEYVIPTPS